MRVCVHACVCVCVCVCVILRTCLFPLGFECVSLISCIMLPLLLMMLIIILMTLLVMCTGVIVAILGKEPDEDRGKLFVEDYCFQLLPEQVPRPALTEDK